MSLALAYQTRAGNVLGRTRCCQILHFSLTISVDLHHAREAGMASTEDIFRFKMALALSSSFIFNVL